MAKYQRSTRACAVSQLKPPLLRALRAYFQSHNLGELETECLQCCETVSEKKPSGNWLSAWLDNSAEETIYSAIVLTGRVLVWARSSGQGQASAVGTELVNINARVHIANFTNEVGLQVAGLIDGSRGNVRGVIALGQEQAALDFCDAVYNEIEKVNPTPKRKWPAWMGGSRDK